jgi:glycosyltransferase involved in cell wall biosynthesis
MSINRIVILCHNPWEWSADFANQTAYQLRKNHTVICFLLGDAVSLKEWIFQKRKAKIWQKISVNLYAYTPIYIIPMRRFGRVLWLNMMINVALLRFALSVTGSWRGIRKNLLWIFYPGDFPLVRAFGQAFTVLYDCVDFFDGDSVESASAINIQEEKLIKTADLFFVNSHSLYSLHKPTRKAKIVPQGFRLEEFRLAQLTSNLPIPTDKPVIGYIGGLNYRLDYPLISEVIAKCPRYYFVFVGPIQDFGSPSERKRIVGYLKKLCRFKNFLYFPDQPKQAIPALIQRFSIGIIPYDLAHDFNRYCFPMKLFEYFFSGKPVVATPILELRRYPMYVSTASTASSWEANIRNLLDHPLTPHQVAKLRGLAQANSWESKIVKILAFIERYVSRGV